ncbi:MAG: M20 family peptidase, partial [Pseudomonadota bacterium]
GLAPNIVPDKAGLGEDAMDAFGRTNVLPQLCERLISGDQRVQGIFTETGLAPNIVPDKAAGLFYVRAKNAGDLADLKVRVQACFDAGALSSGCRAEVEWAKADYLDMKTSFAISEAYVKNAETLGRTFVDLAMLPSSSAGSTDMGNVSHRVPSIHPMISCAPANVVIHNPEFAKWAGSDLGDKAVVDGAKSLAMTALDFLMSPDMQRQAKADFEESADVSRDAVSRAYNPHGLADIGGCGCC